MNEADYQGGLAVLIERSRQAENGRGILFVPAGRATTADIVTMVTEGRGICSVTINEATAMRLGLYPQGKLPQGDAPYMANSVESTMCTETGISASERATTLRTVGDAAATAADLVTPGHIMVHVARNVLRDGATLPEVANALLSARRVTRFAGWIDILDDRGEMAGADWCATLAARLALPCFDANHALAFSRAELAAWSEAARFSQDAFG